MLVSHGTGGTGVALDWLACGLARAGYVVLSVDHHGNTGSELYRAEGFLCLWERARDISALLDDGGWRRRLGGSFAPRAAVAGFSAGAYAALLLVGAQVLYSQFEPGNPDVSPIRGPKEWPDLAAEVPRLLDSNRVFRESWERRTVAYGDDRILAAIALAPGRSVRGFSERSLREIARPVQLMVGDDDEEAPPADCAFWLNDRVPTSRLESLGAGVGHYIFLPQATEAGRREAPRLFVDGPGVERVSVQQRVFDVAVEFLAASRW